MKIKIFGFNICFHKWRVAFNKYGMKIRKCEVCNKTQIQLFDIDKKKPHWKRSYDSSKM